MPRLFLLVLVLGAACPARASGQSNLADLDSSITSLADRVLGSVVHIESDAYAPVVDGFSESPLAVRSSAGSGVILTADGYIVTNAHVVASATRVWVRMARAAGPEGQSVLPQRGPRLEAVVAGLDTETDLALLKVEADSLPALELADSELVRQGQLVLAFGSPLGLENSVSMGIVSSAARQLEPEDRVIYIQTDAPINPGNSGGPLVDTSGRVVGINTMILSPSGASAGVGLAVPSNIVRSVVDQLRERGRFVRGDIGVNAQTITPEMAAGLGLEREYGVILSDVRPGGAAYAADLRIGDIVLSLDGKPMENARQFLVNLYGKPLDAAVPLEILRNGMTQTRFVIVRFEPDTPENVVRFLNMQQRRVVRLGVLAVPVDDNLRGFLPVSRLPGGVLVTGILLSGSAPRDVVATGDIIYSVNGQPVESVDQLEDVLGGIGTGQTAVLQIERGGRLSYVSARLN